MAQDNIAQNCCCGTRIRLVIFDEELPEAQTMVNKVKELFASAKIEKECAFVAMIDQSRFLLNGKPYSKEKMLDEAESQGYTLLMPKPLAVEELGRLVKEFV
jgi:hypothetical protein